MYGSNPAPRPVETRARLRREVLAALAAFGIAPALAVPPEKGQPVTWPEVPLIDGTRLPASHWSGQAAVVVFWASTCPFCRRHNEHVQKLHTAAEAARAAGRRAPRVLTVARDRDVAVVRQYARTRGYGFPISMDYAALSQALSTRNTIPLTVTVDRQGRLRQAIPGEMFEEDMMELLTLDAA
jgi:thiol-disulfide isomerase/thioredoxin